MVNKLGHPYYVTLFGNMGTFPTLTNVIFVRSDIYQLNSAMCKKVFSCSETGPAPV